MNDKKKILKFSLKDVYEAIGEVVIEDDKAKTIERNKDKTNK